MLVVNNERAFTQVLEEPLRVALAPTRRTVSAAPSGEVGLCEYRKLDIGQHDAAVERCNNHSSTPSGIGGGERKALVGQKGGESLRTRFTIGGDNDGVLVVEQRTYPRNGWRQIADDWLPAGRGDNGCRRLVGRRKHRPRRRIGSFQQTIERQMQTMDLVSGDVPSSSERRRKVGFLSDDLGCPVTHAPWLHKGDEAVAPDQIGQQMLSIDEPRQPRLHAVEERSVGKTIPLLASPRLGLHQLGCLRPSVLGRPKLATRVEHRLVDGHGRALVGDRELGQPIDLIAPQVDPDRGICRTRVDINDRTSHGDLASMLNLSFTAIPEHDQSLDEFDRIDLIAGAYHDRFDHRSGIDALHQRSSRRHDERRWTIRAEPVQHAQTLAHRLDSRTHPFEWQGLPRWKVQDPIRAKHGTGIGREAFSLGLGGSTNEDWPPVGRCDEARQHQRTPGVTDGDHRFAATERSVDRRIVAESIEKVAERSCGGVRHGDQETLKRFIVASMSDTARNSTASAAFATTRSRTGRSARAGRLSTQSRPVMAPGSGLPTPIRSRENPSARR